MSNSRDPWRDIIGAHHGHHGGGHHHHGGGGRRYFGGGYDSAYPYYNWGYADPYYQPEPSQQVVIIDNRIRRYDRWGRPIIGLERGIPYAREGVLGEVAPILAPASAGITATIELDKDQRLHANICVDGQCYKADINLAPAIAVVMKKLADQHASWHAQGQPQVHGWQTIVGLGDCGGRMYKGVNGDNLNQILNRLRERGASITGSNPVWEVDTRDHGVKFKGTYYKTLGKLMLEVTDSAYNAPCFAVWDELEPMLRSLGIQRDDATAMNTVKALDKAVHAAGEGLVDSLVGHHDEVICGAWLDDVQVGGWFDKVKKGVKGTLKKHKGKIAKAAGAAAAAAVSAVPGGAALAPTANKIATKLVDAAAGDGDAKALVERVKKEAKSNPDVAQALASAKKAAAKTAATFAVADTAKEAVEGNHEAKQEIAKIEKAADQGDKAAQVATDIANQATGGAATRKGRKARAQAEAQTQGPADPMPKEDPPNQPAPQPDPWANTQNDPAPATPDHTKVVGEIPDGELAGLRRTATLAAWDALQRRPSAYLGYRRIGTHQRVFLFRDSDQAHDWYTALTPGYTYAAIFNGKDMETAKNAGGAPEPIVESMERVNWTLPVKVKGSPWVQIIGATLATVRKEALDAARSMPGKVVGIVRWADGNWSMDPFETTDLADDWLGDVSNQPRLFTYAAYYDKGDRTWPGPMNEKLGSATKARPAISGDAPQTSEVRPLVKVPVLDEAHVATRQFALWVLPYPPPDFYVVSAGGDMWLFADPNGTIVCNGNRYRPDYPVMKATLVGDPGRRKNIPTSTEVPGMT